MDLALERFDNLSIRTVEADDEDTAATFLARFQSTAAELEPDGRIKLVVYAHESGVELLKAVLADPQASKVCFLHWVDNGEEDVNSIIPLLIPELLASLDVNFKHHSAFDFVSSVLEHPSTKLKVLEMPPHVNGNIPRFFAALERSQVSALTLSSSYSAEFYQSLCNYLAKDLLVRLKVWQVPSDVMTSLAKCTRLTKLEVARCEFSQPTAFAQSTPKLVFDECTFLGGFDWSFLADSNVQELDFYDVREVNGSQLGSALAVRLKAKGLDTLRLGTVGFTDDILAAAGVEIGRVKRLEVFETYLNRASVELLALALRSPNSELRELSLGYTSRMMGSIETRLVPALRHPSCTLTKLSFFTGLPAYEAAATRVKSKFHNRLRLFALLQGQQMRRRYCPLRRLPVEMFRLVGEVLI